MAFWFLQRIHIFDIIILKSFFLLSYIFAKEKKKGKEKIPLGDAIVFSLEDCFLRKAECLGIGELRPPLPSFLFKN